MNKFSVIYSIRSLPANPKHGLHKIMVRMAIIANTMFDIVGVEMVYVPL